MTKAPELLPCPFCGKEATFEHPITEAVVGCRTCQIIMTRSVNPLIYRYNHGREVEKTDVIESWNTRAAMQPALAEAEARGWNDALEVAACVSETEGMSALNYPDEAIAKSYCDDAAMIIRSLKRGDTP